MEQVLKAVENCERVEINEQNPFVLLCCYGTLRLGCGNYDHYLKGRSEHLGTFKTEPKYTMYGFKSGFPIVVPGGNTPITCDVFKVTQQRVLERIHGLEGFKGCVGHRANWYDCQKINTPYGPGYIYLQPGHIESAHNIIERGDWLRRNFQ